MMKIKIEILFGENTTYINFWNWFNGEDVLCRFVDGKLLLEEEESEREISFPQFMEIIQQKAQEILQATENAK